MPVMHPAAQQTEALLRQLVDTLEEISLHYASEDEDDRMPVAQEREMLMAIVEEATERGMEEEHVEKILRAALQMAKEGREA